MNNDWKFGLRVSGMTLYSAVIWCIIFLIMDLPGAYGWFGFILLANHLGVTGSVMFKFVNEYFNERERLKTFVLD